MGTFGEEEVFDAVISAHEQTMVGILQCSGTMEAIRFSNYKKGGKTVWQLHGKN